MKINGTAAKHKLIISADFLSKSISLYVTVNGVNSNVYIVLKTI